LQAAGLAGEVRFRFGHSCDLPKEADVAGARSLRDGTVKGSTVSHGGRSLRLRGGLWPPYARGVRASPRVCFAALGAIGGGAEGSKVLDPIRWTRCLLRTPGHVGVS
jgi:hypothetical protein